MPALLLPNKPSNQPPPKIFLLRWAKDLAPWVCSLALQNNDGKIFFKSVHYIPSNLEIFKYKSAEK